MQILIPMCGTGSRFSQAGYSDPKPWIDVNGKPMIWRVLENFGWNNQYILVVQKSQLSDYSEQVALLRKQCVHPISMIVTDSPTQGAAESCLLASEAVCMVEPLIIANCDQIFSWDQTVFETWANAAYDGKMDGAIFVFPRPQVNSQAYSYAKVDDNELVVSTAEKEVISDLATTGVHYWAQAHDFFRAARQMISKDIRTNGEFYIAPVYNENIAQEAKIGVWHVAEHWPIGTPEDLQAYLAHSQGLPQ